MVNHLAVKPGGRRTSCRPWAALLLLSMLMLLTLSLLFSLLLLSLLMLLTLPSAPPRPGWCPCRRLGARRVRLTGLSYRPASKRRTASPNRPFSRKCRRIEPRMRYPAKIEITQVGFQIEKKGQKPECPWTKSLEFGPKKPHWIRRPKILTVLISRVSPGIITWHVWVFGHFRRIFYFYMWTIYPLWGWKVSEWRFTGRSVVYKGRVYADVALRFYQSQSRWLGLKTISKTISRLSLRIFD